MLGMLNRLHQQQEAVHAYDQEKTVHPKPQQDLLSDLEVDKRSFFFKNQIKILINIGVLWNVKIRRTHLKSFLGHYWVKQLL